LLKQNPSASSAWEQEEQGW